MGGEGGRTDRFVLVFNCCSEGDLVLCSYMCGPVLTMLVSGKLNRSSVSCTGQDAVLEVMGELGSRKDFVQLVVTVSSNAMRAVLDHAAGPFWLTASRSSSQGKDRHVGIENGTVGGQETEAAGLTIALSPFLPWKVCICPIEMVYMCL